MSAEYEHWSTTTGHELEQEIQLWQEKCEKLQVENTKLLSYIIYTPCWLCTMINPFRQGANCGQCAKAREAIGFVALLK